MLKILTKNFKTIIDKILSSNKTDWNSLKITYEQPNVDRLWTTWNEPTESSRYQQTYRLCLHKIYPCENPFYHPHDWKSACYIAFNSYLMKLGYKNQIINESLYNSGSFYEMTVPELWHSVCPQDNLPVYSIMLMGEKYSTPNEPLRRPEVYENGELTLDEIDKILNQFKLLLTYS